MSDRPEDDDDPIAPTTTETGAVNVADPASVRAARRRGERKETETEKFYRAVLADPIGRREMWAILESGGAFTERFGLSPSGVPDPVETQRQEGEKRFSFRLYLSWMRHDPDGVALMLQENHSALMRAEPKRKRG